MLKLGYKASAEQFPPRQLLEFAVHAEAVGFDSIMMSDHFQPWRHTDGHAPFSFAWMGMGWMPTYWGTVPATSGTRQYTPWYRFGSAHGGGITATSAGPGLGATFTVRLPSGT